MMYTQAFDFAGKVLHPLREMRPNALEAKDIQRQIALAIVEAEQHGGGREQFLRAVEDAYEANTLRTLDDPIDPWGRPL